VEKVFSMPGIQLPQRETIHLPALVPHSSTSGPASPPPISISITYTKTTPTTDAPTDIPQLTTPTAILPPTPTAILPPTTPTAILPLTTPTRYYTAVSENHTSCVAVATSPENRVKLREGRRDSSLEPHSNLAPAALEAVNIHRLRPIRSSTYLQGESISRHAPTWGGGGCQSCFRCVATKPLLSHYLPGLLV